jgi:hypothetical protein
MNVAGGPSGSAVNIGHRPPTILNFVIMTWVLLEQHQSHDHEVGGGKTQRSLPRCPFLHSSFYGHQNHIR